MQTETVRTAEADERIFERRNVDVNLTASNASISTNSISALARPTYGLVDEDEEMLAMRNLGMRTLAREWDDSEFIPDV